ncbi:unnamed protein product [Didymodactylos carnosus]|uniref:DUF866 domain-containing protein n=1 Tax=Didymodactylos carnosus TaxID=1234261 RepID=A0A814QV17_9BILA|nr:unnamed protein product [Didymodactylos carnosus]CAF1124648.1 unnamed protein product [Didymodactylos carnosus]CAF3714666.1 unnamed protein product [Didymodactylos carnosus]CAF3888140.1 unnamed protein product [Didymodactylos carnosus]
MVKIGLQIKATLENITNFRIESCNDFIWYLKLQCTHCKETSDMYHDINIQQSSAISGSRGEAHFIMKCKFCSYENSLNVDVIQPSVQYTADDSDRHIFKTIVVFDCRGIEPIDWQPGDGWTCEGIESETKFKNIDLSENKEWTDYDEKSKQPVSINDIEHKFIKVR